MSPAAILGPDLILEEGGGVINVPESQGAVPSGRGSPKPGESALSPGNGGELGKCGGG